MKLVCLSLLSLALATPVMAADFCRHEDAAEVIDTFLFSTQAGTEQLLDFITAENERHADLERQTELAVISPKSFEAGLLHLEVEAKRNMSLHIEEELRCRLGLQD